MEKQRKHRIKAEDVSIDVLAMLDEAEKATRKSRGKIPVFLISHSLRQRGTYKKRV